MGYKKAMKEHDIPVLEENIISVDKTTDLDFILPPILNHNKKISAIFAMSDELLAKTLYYVNKLNLSIPEDISIISISDGDYPYLTHPQITHVKDSGSKMGRNACKFLINSISKPSTNQNAGLFVSTKLVELQSVKKRMLE